MLYHRLYIRYYVVLRPISFKTLMKDFSGNYFLLSIEKNFIKIATFKVQFDYLNYKIRTCRGTHTSYQK